MNEIEKMPLVEIQEMGNDSLITIYDRRLEELSKDKIAKKIIDKHYGESIERIFSLIEEEDLKYQSEIFFYGDRIKMYPNIQEPRARKEVTCDFSGGIILPGSLYASFRPMLKNIDDGNAYVLKRTIKVENSYIYDLPRNLSELESLAIRMQCETSFGGIDFSHLSQRMGGELVFQKLKRR